MDEQSFQYHSHSAHKIKAYAGVEQQRPVGSDFDLVLNPLYLEWFHPTLYSDSLASNYQALFYPATSSGPMSHYRPDHLVDANRSQMFTPSPAENMMAPTVQTTPSWEIWNTSEAESSSPADEKCEEDEVWEPKDLRRMGYLDAGGNWRCRFEGCRSPRVFVRACDLRKHFRGHEKYFFCAETPCAGAGVGFATRKDYERHMGSHRPTIECPHPDCGRIFSRKDNMRDHFKKIHLRLSNNLFPKPCRRPRRGQAAKVADSKG
ncbi:Putative Zinc finger C2H2-type [Colletotrichum destructivum]|uniref:Zinc finger C2H2-type n=1 Tax=Colletotrichum destructivum TaxID=34406 RepID=A0AAX4ICG8_9PEZI|nr:Putative Zinc finger C2H2-type [Colletotrichum destructivum]